MPQTYFALAAGSDLSALVNFELAYLSADSDYPNVVQDGGTPVLLLPPTVKGALSGASYHSGIGENVLRVSEMVWEEFDAFMLALFGGYTTAFVDAAYSGLAEDGHYNPFLIKLRKPVRGTHYKLTDNGVFVRDLRIPFAAPRLQSATKSADYTATAADRLIYVDTSAGDVTITLPAASSPGAYTPFSLVKIAAAHTMKYKRAGSDTLNGGTTTLTATAIHARVDYYSDHISAWKTF